MKLGPVFALALLAACGGSSQAPRSATSAPVKTAAPAPAPTGGPVVTLKQLENGDDACYVVIVGPKGEESLPGDFDLCAGNPHDATSLVGKQVTYTTKQERIVSAACEGNLDCGKSDQVDLVVTITAAP